MKRALNILAILALALVAARNQAQQSPQSVPGRELWVASWGASQQVPEPQNALPADQMRDLTLRQIVRLSAGGDALRVHLSNAFGTEALHFTSVHVARALLPSSSAIDQSTDRPLTFAGLSEVVVPPGAEFVSDPLELAVAPLSNLAVTFHLDRLPDRDTGHPGSRATSYYVQGDFVGAANLPDAKQIEHWYQLAQIDVRSAPGAGSIVALGDSITDGHGATTNGNNRWTDVLAERLQAGLKSRNIGVSNQGIGGNHLLTDGLGPNALARFDRDVLAPAGVRWVIVFEGVNDLGAIAQRADASAAEHAALVQRVVATYQQMIERAHAHGLRIYGATITPYVGSTYYHPGLASEADRQAVNQWIRAVGHFDAVIDFDAVVGDPQHPDQLLPRFDCSDHLHPSAAGYKAMGDAIPLDLFAR
jgi:lysophospholipase L1-like esterase